MFNNTKVKTLKLERTAPSSSGEATPAPWQFNLGEVGNYATAPLGNNTALTNIEFVLNTSEELSAAPTSALKAQPASIYNLFANYSSSSSVPNNLAAWGASSSGSTGGGTIQADLSASSLTNWVPSASGTHNGVTWEKKDSSTSQQVVITGSANIYRTKNGNNSYQTYFASGAGEAKAKQVTIKITINKMTSSTGRWTN